jgi:hypothetical protein
MAKTRQKGKRDPRNEQLEKGRSLLAAWGLHDFTLPSDTPAGEALEKLESFIGKDPACDVVIAGWLGRFADPSVARRLVTWEQETKDKDLRREIRRSLFKLEQKGIEVKRPEEPKPAFTLGDPSSEPQAYLGAIDGDGTRMAWLLRSDRGGTTGLFTVISDVEGMVYVDAVTARRQALKATIKDAISESGPLVAVPWKYADSLMSAAFKKGSPRPGSTKGDYLLNRGEITQDEAGPVPPCPIVEILPEAETSDEGLLEKSAELFREKEFGAWVLPAEIARTHLQQYADSTSSGLVLSKEAAAERAVGIMDAALEEFIGGPLRTLYIRRTEEMAYLLHLRGKEEAARRAMAVARALATPEGRTMKEISFFRAFVFRAFAPYFAPPDQPRPSGDQDTDKVEGSSRIIDPSKVRVVEQTDGPKTEPGDKGDSPVIIRP